MAKHVADARSNTTVSVDRPRSRTPDAAPADPLAPLFAPARALKGIGPRLEQALARLFGLPAGSAPRCLDLLWHLPQAALDRRLLADPAGAAEGERVTLVARIGRHEPAPGFRPSPRRPYRVWCDTALGRLQLVFFHARELYLRETLPEGAERVISGRLARYGRHWQVIHPELIATPAAFTRSGPVEPVYPLTAGLSGRVLGRLTAQALAALPPLPEWQDQAWLRAAGWPDFATALRQLHQPAEPAAPAPDLPARRRLAFDELLANQLALALVRQRATGRPGRSLTGDDRHCRALLAALPFRLTGGQQRVLAGIRADLERPARMLRLLQGDVGSGKTLIALLAMLTAVEAGAQAALMAPTEVLARQHLATLTRLLAPCGIAPALLTGRERGRPRQRLLSAIACGRAPIVVGTHALFQDDVAFADLGLAVIDEQHRFGVHQRLGLAAKGRQTDLLVMTATPIPRTLVLALYGDMAVSELREKPPGRQAIQTRAMSLGQLERILAATADALERGERLYWVCPLIGAVDGDEFDDQATAEHRYQALGARFGALVGLVHGRMPAAEKDRVMAAFAAGRIRLLVATTVIEVGVDVPEATVMVIERAERFGLAQLHQLRGRVGRGARPSTCLLLYGAGLGATARARLEVMRATDDGFRIAEEDLRLRGPGEVLGARQSGLPALRLADLTHHADLLGPVRDDVRLCLERDPALRSARGEALRLLLRLFEREAAIAYLHAG